MAVNFFTSWPVTTGGSNRIYLILCMLGMPLLLLLSLLLQLLLLLLLLFSSSLLYTLIIKKMINLAIRVTYFIFWHRNKIWDSPDTMKLFVCLLMFFVCLFVFFFACLFLLFLFVSGWFIYKYSIHASISLNFK